MEIFVGLSLLAVAAFIWGAASSIARTLLDHVTTHWLPKWRGPSA